MAICKRCENIVGLSAMQFTPCKKCGKQVVTGHIPAYQYCEECAKELGVCHQCGKEIVDKNH